ncbi:MAG: nitroreductase family deazaflavin-dependent oxidoreductase [Gammaproteobacteria bacterium]|nr:nitroreductase family deazaflavin-dependent oxidoreductase [Gammaproteobacteria bacterium]
MNRFMVLAWRLGFGPSLNMWPSVGGRILVLVHTGRKSGNHYYTPLNYAPDGDVLYCLVGFGPRTDWFRNVLANPNVCVWLPTGRWSGVAHDATDDPDRNARMRQVLIASGFAAWILGLHPKRMSDEQVAEATHTYRLVRIVKTERLAGPGDLTWVWALPAAKALVWAMRRRRSTPSD